jgi:hypothetical protein
MKVARVIICRGPAVRVTLKRRKHDHLQGSISSLAALSVQLTGPGLRLDPAIWSHSAPTPDTKFWTSEAPPPGDRLGPARAGQQPSGVPGRIWVAMPTRSRARHPVAVQPAAASHCSLNNGHGPKCRFVPGSSRSCCPGSELMSSAGPGHADPATTGHRRKYSGLMGMISPSESLPCHSRCNVGLRP